MRPVSKDSQDEKEYRPYGGAKPDLIDALGPYCSYCERFGYSTALDVEHVEDKNNNPEKKYLWSNFLLACKNCNSIKGDDPVSLTQMLFPHLGNSFPAFKYVDSGLVLVNEYSPDAEKARSIMDLVGLDRYPGHQRYSSKDTRWKDRKKAWELSKRYLAKYENDKADIETIVDLASSRGHWSIWMNSFREHHEVLEAFFETDAFPGTKYKTEILAHLSS